MNPAQSPRAAEALALVEGLQSRLVEALGAVAREHGEARGFERVDWDRDEGRHGGGHRAVAPVGVVFDRASVNVSQVHYDDLPEKRLSSATALSAIVHPFEPHAPSVHMHFSYTEMRDGGGYWRMMADLNPSLPVTADTQRFAEALAREAGALYSNGASEGDAYFWIPALERHRGATHFYLESYDSGDFVADKTLAQRLSHAAIDTYAELLRAGVGRPAGREERARQLAYHTLYFFQVLTLDRGTTSGLLVHAQNDVGILGSLPSRVDPDLLASWRPRLDRKQRPLLDRIVAQLPVERPATVSETVKAALAREVRAFYRDNPGALELQARGSVVPPTVANHAAPLEAVSNE